MVLLDILTDPTLAGHRPGQTLIADKNYYGRDSKPHSPRPDCTCCARPARRTRTSWHPVLQTAAAGHRIDQRHLKGQLDLEDHGGHTPAGVSVRILQRILALTAAIWHNDNIAPQSNAP